MQDNPVRHPGVIEVLNHGHVRLVESMGNDLSIVRNARVSYDAEWRSGEDAGKDEKLINYLVKNHHTSPFESAQFTFDIKCPMFVARQWMRHRTWSYNEVSARYSQLPDEMYVPDPTLIGVQSKDNKQMREVKKGMTLKEISEAKTIAREIEAMNNTAYYMYEEFIRKGVPRELARGVLPMNIYTHFFATVDLHNLMGFLRLRLHEHAQYEIRVYAEAMLQLIEPIVPVSVKAFKEHVLGDVVGE